MPGCCCSFCFSIYDLAKIKLQFIEINKRSLRLSSLKQRGVGSLFSSLFFLALCLHAALHHPNAWNRLEDYAKGTTKQRLQQRNNETWEGAISVDGYDAAQNWVSEFFRPYGVLTIIYLKPPLYGYLVITVCFLVSMESFYIFSKFNTFADKGAGDKRHVFLVHPTRVLTENWPRWNRR